MPLIGNLQMDLNEQTFTIKIFTKEKLNWYLDLNSAPGATLPFKNINKSNIACHFEGMDYRLLINKGAFSKPSNGAVFRMMPQDNLISLNLATSVK